MLTQEKIKEVLHYDPETGVFIWLKNTGGGKVSGSIAGSVYKDTRGNNYNRIQVFGRAYGAHRLSWLYTHGYWPDKIDHIDGNGLNNKLTNLRNVSNQQNCRNKRLMPTNTSGFCGVYFVKTRKKWRAFIRHENKILHLGDFICKDDAISARKMANIKYGYHENHGTKR